MAVKLASALRVLTLLMLAATPALAQQPASYPARAVRIIVPETAGGCGELIHERF